MTTFMLCRIFCPHAWIVRTLNVSIFCSFANPMITHKSRNNHLWFVFPLTCFQLFYHCCNDLWGINKRFMVIFENISVCVCIYRYIANISIQPAFYYVSSWVAAMWFSLPTYLCISLSKAITFHILFALNVGNYFIYNDYVIL